MWQASSVYIDKKQKGGSKMEGAIYMRNEQINYVKPNMAALHGKIGRSIIETILNTPKPDDSRLKERAREVEARMLAAKKNGTF